MRSSTKRTTRSFASWSNFLGIFQIFSSTQTEQNLGHFSYPVITVIANIPDHRPDLVQRNFRDQALRRLWVAEITYVRTLSGVRTPRLSPTSTAARLSVLPHVRQCVLIHCLWRLWNLLSPPPVESVAGQLVHHSDRGSQRSL